MIEESEEERPHRLDPNVHWSRATGYSELGMFDQARIELAMLPDDLPWGKQKRAMMTEVLQALGDWTCMRKFAHELRMEFPQEVQWWVADAYATRRCESIEGARGILLEALVHHYDDALIRYNLACYACKNGSFGECLDFLKEAVKRDAKFKQIAINDEDLMEVRDALNEMGWGDIVV